MGRPRQGTTALPVGFHSRFFGVVVTINYDDHNPPHFHAEYQGFEAIYKYGRKNGGQSSHQFAQDYFEMV